MFSFVKHRKLEEKCSLLESRIFQLENRNDSIDCDIENMTYNKPIAVPDKSNAEDKNSKSSLPKQSVRIDFEKTVSAFYKLSAIVYFTKKILIFIPQVKMPALNIRSSSIAGLSPLLKRAKTSDTYKLSPINNDKPETFSILKRPRLLQSHIRRPGIAAPQFTFKSMQK